MYKRQAVAYKVVEALYEVLQRDVDDVDYLMENVAIATVGDVMDLCGENRVFVKMCIRDSCISEEFP